MGCLDCNSTGIKLYSNTATYMSVPGIIAGAAMTEDICDVCWGSKNKNLPKFNIREARETINKIKALHIENGCEVDRDCKTYDLLFPAQRSPADSEAVGKAESGNKTQKAFS